MDSRFKNEKKNKRNHFLNLCYTKKKILKTKISNALHLFPYSLTLIHTIPLLSSLTFAFHQKHLRKTPTIVAIPLGGAIPLILRNVFHQNPCPLFVFSSYKVWFSIRVSYVFVSWFLQGFFLWVCILYMVSSYFRVSEFFFHWFNMKI